MRVLFVNRRSGGAGALERVVAAARSRGIEVRELGDGAEGAEVVGVAGGDGSLSEAAALALERELPLVVVPLGTRNHFARDLGLDLDDPVAALDAFDGEERRVDVGRVNGRVFLNNVSLGAYAAAVQRERRGTLRAVARWLLRFRRSPLRLTVDGEERKVLVLMVGNNDYGPSGRRERLDGGALSAYAFEHGRLLGLRRETEVGTAFAVEARARRVRAAIDGEPTVLESPLRFELEPRALRVMIPR